MKNLMSLRERDSFYSINHRLPAYFLLNHILSLLLFYLYFPNGIGSRDRNATRSAHLKCPCFLFVANSTIMLDFDDKRSLFPGCNIVDLTIIPFDNFCSLSPQ